MGSQNTDGSSEYGKGVGKYRNEGSFWESLKFVTGSEEIKPYILFHLFIHCCIPIKFVTKSTIFNYQISVVGCRLDFRADQQGHSDRGQFVVRGLFRFERERSVLKVGLSRILESDFISSKQVNLKFGCRSPLSLFLILEQLYNGVSVDEQIED